MPAKQPARPAHDELARLGQRVTDAATALRRAEEHEAEANTAIERARDQVREAHDLGADPVEATTSLARAKQEAEQAVLAREGIEARVRRATHEREAFLAENGEELINELQPDCDQVTADLRAAAEALVLADRAWRTVSVTVARYLSAAHLSANSNAPGEHGLESLVKDARRALARDIRSPSPHWHEANANRVERETVAKIRRERAAA